MKAILFSACLLVGCSTSPSGISMSEDERKACAEHGCTVWTQQELQGLARQFYLEGMKRAKG